MLDITTKTIEGIDDNQLKAVLADYIEGLGKLKKLLLLPPDITRMHSYAGRITEMLYDLLKDSCQVDIMPALGTHVAMTKEECRAFFGDVPYSSIIEHNWRTDVVKIGEVPAAFVEEVSEGLMCEPMDVEVNKCIVDPSYDLVLSIGQVVPHEVIGMANYNKNIFVGCGGSAMINSSHMLGAIYGMERIMGRDHSPVRKVFDYAESKFLKHLPLQYVLTVTTEKDGKAVLNGLFVGRERSVFEKAVALSQQKNLTLLGEPFKKVVVHLDEMEFKSTWLGNKAIYRTRMAIADDGELIIIAPGVERFGEDPEIDNLIRKYGYKGRLKVMDNYRNFEDLQQNQSAAAHLIHGSSDGRFKITYCPGHLTEEEVKGVGFNYMPLEEAQKKYRTNELNDGFNTVDGEQIFYVSNPALGLWADKNKFS